MFYEERESKQPNVRCMSTVCSPIGRLLSQTDRYLNFHKHRNIHRSSVDLISIIITYRL